MKKSSIKIGIFCLLILFLSIGAISASENTTEPVQLDDNDLNEISTVEDQTPMDSQNTEILKDNATSQTPEKAQITVSQIEGNEGKTLTLKATVKKENGATSPATVKFTFNGNTYTAPTDSNGVASVTIKFPKSAVLKTTSKTKGKVLTKTTYYQKSYTCDVTADGDEFLTGTASFKVISKKAPLVKKYKIIKKKKTYTIKIKKGVKIAKAIKAYKVGNYAVVSYKHKKGGYTIYEFGMMDKNGKTLKFSIKHHYKQNGKWKWDKWLKVPNGKVNEFGRYGTFKMDKIKVKFTTTSYKKI